MEALLGEKNLRGLLIEGQVSKTVKPVFFTLKRIHLDTHSELVSRVELDSYQRVDNTCLL
jgi:hypothetical protein